MPDFQPFLAVSMMCWSEQAKWAGKGIYYASVIVVMEKKDVEGWPHRPSRNMMRYAALWRRCVCLGVSTSHQLVTSDRFTGLVRRT